MKNALSVMCYTYNRKEKWLNAHNKTPAGLLYIYLCVFMTLCTVSVLSAQVPLLLYCVLLSNDYI